jgi:3-hydroxybutyryl-CoA dehydrogenase
MPATLHHAQEYIRQRLSSSALEAEQPRIHFVSSIEDAVRDADLAIDCVPDELESKLEILWLLDRMAPPRTVIATPTMRLSINDLAGCTYRPDKCLAIAADARELAQAVSTEVLMRTTAQTSAESIALVAEFWQSQGATARFDVEPDARQKAHAEPVQSAV